MKTSLKMLARAVPVARARHRSPGRQEICVLAILHLSENAYDYIQREMLLIRTLAENLLAMRIL